MSTILLDLPDRIITDTGAMIAKHSLLLTLALEGERFDHLPYAPHQDIDRYHKPNGTSKIARRWRDDGIPDAPDLETFSWKTPEPYSTMDVSEECMHALVTKGLDDEAYSTRLLSELARAEELEMFDFIRCLVWITDTLRSQGIPWGLGRGSSCASLIMFLLGINKVDPVRYDIPMEEFYK
jgi:DNA polymerase III alpha subunit